MKNIFKKFKKTILIVLAAVLPVFAVLYFGIIRNNQPINHPVGKLPVAQIASSLANLTIPTEFQFKDETIPLTWTDDNSNENLIIQSDRKYYDGRDSSEVYFSITNISSQDQKPDIQFLFDEKEGRGVKEIALLNSQNDVIASGQTNFYKAIIYYPQNSKGEFFISAKGDNNGYGFLDPYYASGLVGYWSFNGADMNWASTTAEALDRSSQNNNGNVINFGQSSAVPGVVGQALYFDGSDDYVLKSNPSWDFTANPTNTFSLSAWFKPNACTDLSGVMLSPFNPIGLRLTVRPTTWLFQLIAGSTYSTGGTCTVGEWTYVVGVYNAVDTKLYLYINGNLVDSDVVALTDTSAIADSLTVGYAGTYFNGLIDEVRVYNRALSASEITDLYRLGLARMKVNTPKTLAGPQSGLVGNWSFNGADMNWASTTAEALDRSGQNNNGNVTNFGQSSAVPGISGQALSFDGANDYVKLGAIALGGDTGTVVATFKADTWPSAGAAMGIIQRYYGDEGIYLRNDSGTKIIQGEVNGGGGVWHGYTSATAVSAGNWYTVAMTYDGLNVRLYVNGQESAASPDPQIGNWGYETYGWLVGSGGAYVPGSWEDLSSYFDGNIDEVRIYSRALSASEITDLYRLGSARLKSNQ